MARCRGSDGAAALVDDDAAALAEGEAGGARQLVARADAGGEDDQVAGSSLPSAKCSAAHAVPSAPATIRLVAIAGVDGDAERLDAPAQEGAAGVVDLQRHQPRRQLDDVGLQPSFCSALAASRPSRPPPIDRADAASAGGGQSRIASRSSIVR